MTVKPRETKEGLRRITVSDNQVQIDFYSKEAESIQKTFKEFHERIFGEYHLVECQDEESISVYNVGEALKVCEVPADSKIQYYIVQKELFVKITNGDRQRIYDKLGCLIAEDKENRLSVLFKGKRIVIRKANKKTDHPNYYSV